MPGVIKCTRSDLTVGQGEMWDRNFIQLAKVCNISSRWHSYLSALLLPPHSCTTTQCQMIKIGVASEQLP
jgi:hypothetical protein